MAVRKNGIETRIDFASWESAYNEFWRINGYSDAMDISDEASFVRNGCDCCAYIARVHGQCPKDGNVYQCKDINGNEFELCGNCLCSAVNGDDSWFDYYADGDGFISI